MGWVKVAGAKEDGEKGKENIVLASEKETLRKNGEAERIGK